MKLAFCILTAIAAVSAAESHAAKGIVLKTDAAHRLIEVSCEAIPGYMDAMEMEFTISDPKSLSGLKTGSPISFQMISQKGKLYAQQIHPATTATFESEPMAAGQLTALASALNPDVKQLAIGDPVPDFALTDQAGNSIHLNQYKGKVVALTFGYSRCPNPNYCFRLSNNLAQVQQRLKSDHDLILMTIMIDPDHDQGATLTEYARAYKADPATWHFLTGPLPEIKQVCSLFGMNFWPVEGLLTHSLHTIIIDRQGRLAVNLEGNQFTPRQLTELVRTVIERTE